MRIAAAPGRHRCSRHRWESRFIAGSISGRSADTTNGCQQIKLFRFPEVHMIAPTDHLTWPDHLHPGAVRFAHVSSAYEASVAFYRDLVGLPVIEDFSSSFGEDGTIVGLPDTTLQLEIVRAHETQP